MSQPEWKSTCCNPYMVTHPSGRILDLFPGRCVRRPLTFQSVHVFVTLVGRISLAEPSYLMHMWSLQTPTPTSDSDAEDSSLQQPPLLEEDSSIQPSCLKTQPSSASLVLVNQCLKESVVRHQLQRES